jgi:hypothetical protein
MDPPAFPEAGCISLLFVSLVRLHLEAVYEGVGGIEVRFF